MNCKCNIISKLSLCNVYIYLHKTIKYECCGILLNQFSPSSNYIYLGRYLQLQSTSLSFCLHWLASIKNLAKQTNSYEFFGGERQWHCGPCLRQEAHFFDLQVIPYVRPSRWSYSTVGRSKNLGARGN